jgi:hypothetical protein
LRDKISGVETGRSGRTINEAQAARKRQQGASIPILSGASGPHQEDCPEGEPEMLKILEKGRSGRKIFVEQTTPNGFQDEFPRGEQNTLRRSDIEVGEGKPVFEIQEVMLSIHSEIPEGEPEILEKTINEDPRNIERSESLARGPLTASDLCDITVALPSEGPEEIFGKPKISSPKSQEKPVKIFQLASGACLGKTMQNQHPQEGPRSECCGLDRRPCQVDVQRFSSSQTAPGACLGKTMPLRTLSLKPLTEVSEIWNEAERRLKADRSHFSLVFNGSQYLPTSGILPKPTQLFEIRWQGRGKSSRANENVSTHQLRTNPELCTSYEDLILNAARVAQRGSVKPTRVSSPKPKALKEESVQTEDYEGPFANFMIPEPPSAGIQAYTPGCP